MTQKIPKISIVTPSFNQAEFIEAAIQSILSQNYSNLEYIIIDGGSTDGSIEIIKKYEKYLHFWCSEPDGGQYEAINKGFAHATGEIMAWLNSDDMYYPWSFRTVVSIMSNLPQVKWLTTLQPGGWDWDGFCTVFGSVPGYSREAFLDGYYVPFREKTIGYIQQESTFWQRNLWQEAGSYVRTDYKLASDFDLWSRFFCHAELYGTNAPLGGFRSQLNQKSRKIDQYLIEAERSLSVMRDSLGWSPKFSRNFSIQLKLNRIPKLRSWIKSTFGYTGKNIVRHYADSPQGYWQIEEYQFFL